MLQPKVTPGSLTASSGLVILASSYFRLIIYANNIGYTIVSFDIFFNNSKQEFHKFLLTFAMTEHERNTHPPYESANHR